MCKNGYEIMLSILQQLDNGHEPKASDYKLSPDEFWKIVEECQNAGYIAGATASIGGRGDKTLIVFLNHADLTEAGLQYLQENKSSLKKM